MTGGQKMTIREAIDTIKIAMSEVEWEYPMEYYVAFDMALKALEKQVRNEEARNEEAQLPEIVRCKDCKHGAYVMQDGMLPFVTCEGVDHELDYFCADGEKWK